MIQVRHVANCPLVAKWLVSFQVSWNKVLSGMDLEREARGPESELGHVTGQVGGHAMQG